GGGTARRTLGLPARPSVVGTARRTVDVPSRPRVVVGTVPLTRRGAVFGRAVGTGRPSPVRSRTLHARRRWVAALGLRRSERRNRRPLHHWPARAEPHHRRSPVPREPGRATARADAASCRA